ncbi:MAG: hypothetical protein VB142_12110 [Burkholderia sp.]
MAEALEAAGYEVWGTVSPEATPPTDLAVARARLLQAALQS